MSYRVSVSLISMFRQRNSVTKLNSLTFKPFYVSYARATASQLHLHVYSLFLTHLTHILDRVSVFLSVAVRHISLVQRQSLCIVYSSDKSHCFKQRQCITNRVFIKYCVFLKYFKIFRTLVFLCFPLVSVCVHTAGRQNTSAAAELAEFRKITKFKGKNTTFNEHPVCKCIFHLTKSI